MHRCRATGPPCISGISLLYLFGYGTLHMGTIRPANPRGYAADKRLSWNGVSNAQLTSQREEADADGG
jgi:hypothetical protein